MKIELSANELLHILDLMELASDIDSHAVRVELYEKIEELYEIAVHLEG